MAKSKTRKAKGGRRSPSRSGARAPTSSAPKPATPEPKTPNVSYPTSGEHRSPKGLDPRSRTLLYGLMGVLLVLFVSIGWIAPDPTSPNGRPQNSVVLWRLVFLLVPLAIMYALLWWDKALQWLRRR